MTVQIFLNLLIHPTFHSEKRLVNSIRRRECFVGLSVLFVYVSNYAQQSINKYLFYSWCLRNAYTRWVVLKNNSINLKTAFILIKTSKEGCNFLPASRKIIAQLKRYLFLHFYSRLECLYTYSRGRWERINWISQICILYTQQHSSIRADLFWLIIKVVTWQQSEPAPPHQQGISYTSHTHTQRHHHCRL